MRVIPAAYALAVGLALGACASFEEKVSDGVPCGSAVIASRVYLDIAYAGDGTPLPIPECTVRSGTVVTWRTRVGEDRPFTLGFKTGNPDDGTAMFDRELAAARGVIEFRSAEEDGRQEARIKAKRVEARTHYKYDVEANGKVLDPVIIIDPN